MTAPIVHILVAAVFIVWLAIAVLSCFGVYHSQRDRPRSRYDSYPPAIVIIPIRGSPANLAALWHGLCTQLYRPFRVVFAVESRDDPAYLAVQALPRGPQ